MNKQVQELIDRMEDINETIADCSKLVDILKDRIGQYFSDELQNDESPIGAQKREQIKKELLSFANS